MHKYIYILITIMLSSLIITGYKKFTVWSQITDYYHYTLYKTDPKEYCKILVEQKYYQNHNVFNHDLESLYNSLSLCDKVFIEPTFIVEKYPTLSALSHFTRTLIFFPIIKLWEFTLVSPHVIFSIVAIFLVCLNSFLISSSISNKNNILSLVIPATALTFASLFMNGRMLFSFTAVSLLIYLTTKLNQSKTTNGINHNWFNTVLLLFTISVLSQVSSGINFIFLILIVLFYFSALKMTNIRNSKYAHLSVLFIVFFQLFFSIIGLFKNFVFFKKATLQETLDGFLKHGLFFNFTSPVSFLLIILFLIILLSIVFKKFKKQLVLNHKISTTLFVLGGFFGKFVFFSVFPYVLFFISQYVTSKINFKEKPNAL